MIQKFFHNLLLRRHFWRYATFSEVSELYTARVLRTVALRLAGAFMSIYLYQLGYSISLIALFWAGFYLFKAVAALPLARFVAWIGPKHAILISNLLYIPAMIMFVMIPEYGPNLLYPTLILQGLSAAMYMISYMIDFSKVKSMQHAGKEIAYMNVFEKVASGISPLIGGVLALFFGPQFVLIIAAILFAFAAAPLFKTGEPVTIHQKLQFRGFPWRLLFRHSLAQWSNGFDVFASGTVWSLYIAVIIIGVTADNNEIYAITGAFISVIFIVALIASYIYGKIIDRNKGGTLMKAATIGNSLTHLMRPFVVSPVTIVGLNAANELATTGYTLPYTRALFDNADISGARTTYLGVIEVISNIGACMAALFLSIVAAIYGEEVALRSFFFVTAGVVLLVLTARFPLYKK